MHHRSSNAGPLRIALMGSRGIPASYSGFETFYEQLATRLVARGHKVTVYNRTNHFQQSPRAESYRGVRLVWLPTIPSKHLDTILHTAFSVMHGILRKYDIVYFCGVGNAPLAWIPRISRARTFLNVDAADYQRDKWSMPAKAYLRVCEILAGRVANVVIADSRVIQQRYLSERNTQTTFIGYGANVVQSRDHAPIIRLGLNPQKYILFVGRLVPENNAHLLIDAFKKIDTDMKLVIAGDAPYAQDYKNDLRQISDQRVIFTGYIFGEDYSSLSCHCYLFVLPARINGTRPVLLDQMGFGNCVLVNDAPSNLEVIGDSGIHFHALNDDGDLVQQLQMLINNPQLVASYRAKARSRIQEHFSWDAITDQYEALFEQMAAAKNASHNCRS